MRIKGFVILSFVLIPNLAAAFGSATILGMRNEHARITQAALSCDSQYDRLNQPSPCFEPMTMSNLGGESPGAFPAVETPDNIALHFSGGPDWWHCDNADYVPNVDYPQQRNTATNNLFQCRKWAEALLSEGLSNSSPYYSLCTDTGAKDFRCTGVGSLARLMLNTKNQVDINQPGYFSLTSGCSFNGSSGRIKCEILQQFGYALHVVQDFYSHSNYADYTDLMPYNWRNPEGLLYSSTPALWDFSKTYSAPELPLPDDSLSTGCYPDEDCYYYKKRTPHLLLNKDRALINAFSGTVSDPRGFRGSIDYNGTLNESRAVEMAIKQTRAVWRDLQTIIINREGEERGRKIICAIASDNPNRDCNFANPSSEQAAIMAYSPLPEPDPTKVAPYPWMLEQYKNEAKEAVNSMHERRVAKKMSEMGHIAGMKSINPKSCGDRAIFKRWGMPDDDISLVAYDLQVAGLSCSKAVTVLRKYQLFHSSANKNGKLYKHPGFQCLVVSEYDGLIPDEEPAARLVCKNRDESKEISFHPDCANESEKGDCGL